MLLSQRLLRPFFSKFITSLFFTLQLSACSTEDFLAAVAPDVGSGGTTNAEVNRPAVISGVDTGSIIEDVDPDGDSLLEVSGKLNITDSDAGEAAFVAKAVNGNYGNFDIDTAGNWSYAASNQQAEIQNLDSNTTLTENQTVSSIDGTTHTIEITIIGIIDSGSSNNAAVITGDDSGSVTEDLDPNGDSLLDVNGTLNITDSDAGEAAFIVATINGNYGNLNIDISGNWSYGAFNDLPAVQNLNTGATLTDNLIVSSVDGTMHNITITISGVDEANQPAVITGVASDSVTEDIDPDGDSLLEVSGKLNITDNDPGEAAFIAKTHNGNYGSLSINSAGNWNYAANNNQTVIQNLATGAKLTDTLTVSSIDGTTRSVVITINGVDEANQPAVITGVASDSVTEDIDPDGDNLLEVAGKLNITDNDPGEAAFIAKTHNGNYGSLSINSAGNWNYAANNNQTVIQNLATGTMLTDTLTVSSIDGTTRSVVITINGVDENNTSTVSLTWVAPSEREDSQPISLSEIAGYTIRYGTTPGQYPNKVTINDGSAVSHTFSNFPTGTHYFVVTTIDTDDLESLYSPEIVVN